MSLAPVPASEGDAFPTPDPSPPAMYRRVRHVDRSSSKRSTMSISGGSIIVFLNYCSDNKNKSIELSLKLQGVLDFYHS